MSESRLSYADALRSRIDASRHDMIALGLPRPLTNEPDGINAALVSTNTLPHNAVLPVPDNPYKLWDGETSTLAPWPGAETADRLRWMPPSPCDPFRPHAHDGGDPCMMTQRES